MPVTQISPSPLRLVRRILALGAILLLMSGYVDAQTQTTAFTYQGKLTDGGSPANSNYDLQFALFDNGAGGTQIGSTLTRSSVAVSGGVFSVQLDFGVSAFPGADRFLEIGVRPASVGSFTPLSPRQQISSTPYAIRTLSAATADSATNASQLGGVAASQYVQTNDSRLSDPRPPTGGSSNYIQNTTPGAGANFNISGSGTAGGTFSSNVVNATTQYNISGQRILSIAGTQNTSLGVNAGATNAGCCNSFFGFNAGQLNNTSDNSFFGNNTGPANTTGIRNSFFGSAAGLLNQTGGDNSFFGVNAGRNNTASRNTFVGSGAGLANTTGLGNAFFGFQAGNENTVGQNNTFVGIQAGQSNLGDPDNALLGSSNSFFGASAGQGNATGGFNTFFGASAGQANTTGSYNAFFGQSAGVNNTSPFNTFVGSEAGFSNTTGSDNAFIGADAGRANTTGSNNTLIGSIANVAAGNLDHATAIGAGAVVSSSSTIVLGRSFTDNVIVGKQMRVQVIPPGGSFSNQVCFTTQGDLLQCTSSLRYKTDVQPFRGGLSTLLKLRPISFKWKQDGQPDIGLGAEDVAKVAPSFASTNSKGEIVSVKYAQLSALFINAIKEQQAQIEQEQKQIATLLTSNAALNARLRSVEKALRKKAGALRQRR